MVAGNINKTPETSGEMWSGLNVGYYFLFQVGSGEIAPGG